MKTAIVSYISAILSDWHQLKFPCMLQYVYVCFSDNPSFKSIFLQKQVKPIVPFWKTLFEVLLQSLQMDLA